MSSPPDHAPDWPETGARAAGLIRVLASDAVQQAGPGHPGTAMSLPPAARVMSVPGVEWFAEPDASYQEEALPHVIRASAADQARYEEFGITAQQVALAARTSLARLRTAASPTTARGGSHEFPA